jgi:DNA adenine methylase
MFLALKQLNPDRTYWVNDLNEEVFLFWKVLRDDPERLIEEIHHLRNSALSGADLFQKLRDEESSAPIRRAARFFALNRITFSGTIETGGYSQQSFDKRFTLSSIMRVAQVAPVLKFADVTNFDFEVLLEAPGDDVFIFLDPPYISATKSRLYGPGGKLHVDFNHERFVTSLTKSPHKWLVTYDDSPEVHDLFEELTGTHFFEWKQPYAMSSHGKAPVIGKELIIANFPLEVRNAE